MIQDVCMIQSYKFLALKAVFFYFKFSVPLWLHLSNQTS